MNDYPILWTIGVMSAQVYLLYVVYNLGKVTGYSQGLQKTIDIIDEQVKLQCDNFILKNIEYVKNLIDREGK